MKKNKIFVLIIVISFLIISLFSFVDNVLYFITRQEGKAEITRIEKLASPKPYKVYLVYYNSYTQNSEKTYIKNIDEPYGEKLNVHSQKDIFYRKYFPSEIYLKDYKSPTIGYLVLSLIFLIIMFFGTILIVKE